MKGTLAPLRVLRRRESQLPAKALGDALQIGHESNAVFTFECEWWPVGGDFLTESHKAAVLLLLQFEDLPRPIRIFDGKSHVRCTQKRLALGKLIAKLLLP